MKKKMQHLPMAAGHDVVHIFYFVQNMANLLDFSLQGVIESALTSPSFQLYPEHPG